MSLMLYQRLNVLYGILSDLPEAAIAYCPPIGYGRAKVAIELWPDGELRAIPPVEIQKGKKTFQQAAERVVPMVRRNGTKAGPITDLGDYVLGCGLKGLAKHHAYLAMLQSAIARTDCAALKALHQLLTERAAAIAATWADDKTNLAEARIVPVTEDGTAIHDLPPVREWWAEEFAILQGGDAGTCALTGKHAPIPNRAPVPVRGVPGASGNGAPLSSYDRTAFCSYGFKGSSHAPLSFIASARAALALTSVLKNPATSYRLENLAYVFWSDGGRGISQRFWQGGTNAASRCFEYLDGRAYDAIAPEEQFFVAAVRGNTGRIAVARSQSLPVAALMQHLGRFLDAQRSELWTPRGIWQLRDAAFHDGAKAKEKQPTEAALIEAALLGRPLPMAYGEAVLRRAALDPGLLRSFYGRDRGGPVGGTHAIALNLYLAMGGIPMNDNAYHLGRAAYWMAKTQQRAQGLTPKDLAHCHGFKRLGALAETPASTFAELYRQHQIYRQSPEAFYEAGKVDSALADLEIMRLPRTFDVDDRAALMLGFAQASGQDITAAIANTAKKGAKSQGESESESVLPPEPGPAAALDLI